MSTFEEKKNFIKKIIAIIVLVFCILYLIIYSLYMKGVFVKEKYTGIKLNTLLICDGSPEQANTIEDVDKLQSVKLSISECKDKYMIIEGHWEYEIKYKYRDYKHNDPLNYEYKALSYELSKNGNIKKYKKNDEIEYEKNVYISSYSYFSFTLDEIGEYELTINLYLFINGKDYSQTRQLKIIVDE